MSLLDVYKRQILCRILLLHITYVHPTDENCVHTVISGLIVKAILNSTMSESHCADIYLHCKLTGTGVLEPFRVCILYCSLIFYLLKFDFSFIIFIDLFNSIQSFIESNVNKSDECTGSCLLYTSRCV